MKCILKVWSVSMCAYDTAAQDRDLWPALVNTIINLRVLERQEMSVLSDRPSAFQGHCSVTIVSIARCLNPSNVGR